MTIERKTPWTPGPWFVSPQMTFIREGSRHGANLCTMADEETIHETMANARLIAEAPAMAELLRRMSRASHSGPALLEEARALLVRIGAPT